MSRTSPMMLTTWRASKKFRAGGFAALLAITPTSALAETGIASIYGNGDGWAGKPTASGGRMNPKAMTAAHRSAAFGSRVAVHNTKTGLCVVVRIDDRGPFIRGRVIDLSPAAAGAIRCPGLCPVTLGSSC